MHATPSTGHPDPDGHAGAPSQRVLASARDAVHDARTWQYDHCCDPGEQGVCAQVGPDVAAAVLEHLLDPHTVPAAPNAPVEPSAAAVDAAAAALHDGFVTHDGLCDHGTYSGGHLHGTPYAMCQILAARVAAAVTRAVVDEQQDDAQQQDQVQPQDLERDATPA